MVVHPASIEMLVEITWNLAHKILWPDKTFSQAELELVKSYIRENYAGISAKKFGKKALKTNQRICRIVLKEKKKWQQEIAHPCIWFLTLNLRNLMYEGGRNVNYQITPINS